MTTDRDIARWRLHSQLLAAPVDGAEQVVRSLLAVQAENPSQSAWAVATRTRSPRPGDLAVEAGDLRVAAYARLDLRLPTDDLFLRTELTHAEDHRIVAVEGGAAAVSAESPV